MTEPILEGTALHKRFGKDDALRDANLSIAAGEMVALRGASGSGKSTLLHCFAGILTPDSGEVTYGGRRIDTLSATERAALRRSEFGFVFQFGELVPELTASVNVSLPLLLGGMKRAQARVRAAASLDEVGVGPLATKETSELSGGERQRVAIARALVAEPKIIFADEPTGALDSLAGERVMEILAARCRDHGTAIVLVTHEPRVAAYADREIQIVDGHCGIAVAASVTA